MVFYYAYHSGYWCPRKASGLPYNDTKNKQNLRSKFVTVPDNRQSWSLKELMAVYPVEDLT